MKTKIKPLEAFQSGVTSFSTDLAETLLCMQQGSKTPLKARRALIQC